MTIGRLLKIAACYFAVIGSASLLVPQAASSGLGHSLTAFDVFAARTIGALLITVAILDWWASAAARTAAPGGVLLANIVMNTVLGVIDAVAIKNGTVAASSWTGIAIHGVLVAAFASFPIRAALHRGRRPA